MNRWTRLGWACVIVSVVLGVLTVIAAQIVFFELQLNQTDLLTANMILNRVLPLEIVLLIAGVILVIAGRTQKPSRGRS
jgi:uncharacterized membrane protein